MPFGLATFPQNLLFKKPSESLCRLVGETCQIAVLGRQVPLLGHSSAERRPQCHRRTPADGVAGKSLSAQTLGDALR